MLATVQARAQVNPAAADSAQADNSQVSLAAASMADTAKAEKPYYDMPRFTLGLRGGYNIADMVYTHQPIERYSHLKKGFRMLGIFSQIPIGKTPLSLRPELTFITRGDSLSWLDVSYGITAHYLDLRLPVTYNFRFGHGDVSPYLMVVPQLCLPYAGRISYNAYDAVEDRSHTTITKADIRTADFGVMLGLGIDFTINTPLLPIYFALEGGYNWGLVNNFAPREIRDNSDNPSNILNNFFGAELWQEKRHTRGVEIAARLSLPIDREFLDRYRERRKVLPDTVTLVRSDTIRKDDTVFVQTEVEVPVFAKSAAGYHTKECFTIRELYDFINNGDDITGKRICMFNINFDFDSYQIRPESEEPLNELVRMMWDYPQMTIEVYGHTDSIGTPEYNQKLSENRAGAVVEYLSNHGVSPSRIKSFGYGLRYPIDTNSTEEGRFRNRRVEFDVITIGLKRKYEE